MKTPEEALLFISGEIQEWRPSEPEWQRVLKLVSTIQRYAFESGRVQGIQDCMGEFHGGSAPWDTLNARLIRMASKRPVSQP